MTTQTMTLADFLLARIAEDEEFARAVSANHAEAWYRETQEERDRSCQYWQQPWNRDLPLDNGPDVGSFAWMGDLAECWDDAAQHVARWGPARVLAECEAKRRIVEDAIEVPTISMRHVLRLLSLPYADHADYREEWALNGYVSGTTADYARRARRRTESIPKTPTPTDNSRHSRG